MDAVTPDDLSEMLGRIGSGSIPQSRFELLHHPRTRQIVVESTRESMETHELEAVLLGDTMNPVKLHEILITGTGFQNRDAEAADGIISAAFVAAVERQVAACLEKSAQKQPGDGFYDLIKNTATIVYELLEGWHPMTLEEVKLYEERTRGDKYTAHRSTIARDGKKPLYTSLKGHPDIAQIMHQRTGNSVWINLLLSAIEADDHQNVAQMVAGITDKTTSKYLHQVINYILRDSVLQVSPQMLNALADIFKDDDSAYKDFCDTALRNIFGNAGQPGIPEYRECIVHIAGDALSIVAGEDEPSTIGWQVAEHGDEKEIRAMLNAHTLTITMKVYLGNQFRVFIMMNRDTPSKQDQIILVRKIAGEYGISIPQ